MEDLPETLASNAVLGRDAFAGDAVGVARMLIGATLLFRGAGGVIVETEAYRQDDAASHSFRGERVANRSMFGPPGHAYVYRSYGIHWCLNVVAERGSAVLIRAFEPRIGVEDMMLRRGVRDPKLIASGPGRVCAALGITRTEDGLPLDAPPFALLAAYEPPAIVAGPRIGISKDVDRPWRFGLKGSRYLSRRLAG